MARGKYASGRKNINKNIKRKNEKLSAEGRITDEILVDVRDVYKSFRVYFDKGSMLKERFVNPSRSRYENREILKGISFQIHRGETVALIGNNGCGKSTTLKMLTKILYPNKGTVTVNGRVSSLIELGAGFHPDMSGRENIYINGSILGLKREQVDARIDDIIRFSELEEYIDNPIRTYSSGMYMRLAFSVAINVDADILLIDEILAVGDQAFQEKCINKLNELRKTGVTVVLVSHAMGQVNAIADRCIWIDQGRIVEDGRTEVVCRHYEAEMERRRSLRDKQEAKEREQERHTVMQEAEEREQGADQQSEASEESAEHALTAGRTTIKSAIKSAIKKREIRRRKTSERWKGNGQEGYPIAALCAVAILLLCHAAQDIYGIGYVDVDNVYPELTWNMRLAGFTLYSVGQTGIPLAFICAGFQWLSNDFSSFEKMKNFWINKFSPFLLLWEIWVFIYQLYFAVCSGVPFQITDWLKQAFFMKQVGFQYAWLVPVLLLCMATAPIAGNILQRIGAGSHRLFLIGVWIIVFLFPGLDLFGQVNGGVSSFSVSFDFICCLFYFYVGYYLSLYVRRIWKGRKELIFYAVLLVFTVVSQLIFQNSQLSYLVRYSYFPVSIMALLEFDIVTRLKLNTKLSQIMNEIGNCAVGIFLIYRPIQEFILKLWINTFGGMFALRACLLWISSLAVCAMIVYGVRKIPYVGKCYCSHRT